jgi:RNA-directed DNA polymerase
VVDALLVAPRLQTITTTRELAFLMGVDYARTFSFTLYRNVPALNYRSFEIPKRDGTARTIHTPSPALKKLQKRLLPLLEELYVAPPSVTGCIKGLSALHNAALHERRRYILNLDLEAFYDSIHFKRVVGILSSARYSLHPSVSTAIAQLCCFEGKLPAGAPTSGILANVVAGPLDSALLRFAKRNRLRVSRYVDDITISSNSSRNIDSCLSEPSDGRPLLKGKDILSDDIFRIISSSGFSVKDRKVIFTSRISRQQVTGVIVNERLNVPRPMIQSIRGALHAIEKFGLEAAQSAYENVHRPAQNAGYALVSRVRGQIQYVGQVTRHGQRYQRLAMRANQVLPGPSLPISIAPAELATVVVQYDISQATAFHVGDGFYITAYHAFPEYVNIRMFTSDQTTREAEAEPIHSDERADYALYRTQEPWAVALPSLRLSRRTPEAGAALRMVGYPNYSLGNSITKTDITIIGQSNRMSHRRLDVNARLEHGASGAPILNMSGSVVGLVHGGPSADDDSPVANSFTSLARYEQVIRDEIARALERSTEDTDQ